MNLKNNFFTSHLLLILFLVLYGKSLGQQTNNSENQINGNIHSVIDSLLKTALKTKKTRTLFAYIATKYFGVSLSDVNLACYDIAKLYGENNGAKPIDELEASTIGNPENIFYVNNKIQPFSILRFYLNYAYCCKHMNFDSIETVAELGSGYGLKIEVLKKLHPHLCFYVFDLPTQLYVCEQYLSTLFPDSVKSYSETRLMKNIPKPQKGKIFFFGNWKISEIDNLNYDLFWNNASFQEMEPSVVLNYLKYIKTI